jgi:hypothetical protein
MRRQAPRAVRHYAPSGTMRRSSVQAAPLSPALSGTIRSIFRATIADVGQ